MYVVLRYTNPAISGVFISVQSVFLSVLIRGLDLQFLPL